MITVNDLRFSYGRSQVLDNLNIHVPEGSIYGFLGPNGAGKSTTIRIILGLLKPQSGNISLFNQPQQRFLPHGLKRVGSLIESPSLYSNLTAKEHLRIACNYIGTDPQRISEILDRVGLANTRKIVRKYSMGMKQRLGMAMALIHDPELLILDECTNGLDPNGISDFRSLIGELRNEGKTIFLSSHILAEVEKTASHVGIINGGKLVFEGSLSELESFKNANMVLSLKITDVYAVERVLSENDINCNISDKQHVEVSLSNENEIPVIIGLLIASKISVYEAKQVNNDLENIFLDITKQSQ